MSVTPRATALRVPVWLVILGALFAGNSCSDFTRPEDFTTLDSAAAPTASNPLTGASAIVGRVSAAGGSAALATETDVTYVSLPPGTVPEGGIATITNTRLNVEVTTAMQDGGFDPVSIAAVAGDDLVIDVQGSGGVTATLHLSVPRAARPRVVRADPPPRKRDVPLNSRIVVVFSEPVAAGSEAGILLRRAGARVPGSVALAPDGLRAEITPSGLLAPNTDYEILIPTTVRDLSGEALEKTVRSTFTTGTMQIVASVATDPAALSDDDNGSQRTFDMSAVRDDNGRFSGRFSIFYAELGWRVFGRIVCFTIVEGNSAWVAGVIEGSNNTASIGRSLGWRAVDHGPPGGSLLDELSMAADLAADGLGTAANFCETTPSVGRSADLIPRTVISGNIVVNGSGPPPPPSSDISKIAFGVWPNGGIQVIDADGTNGHVLTSVEGDFSPAWSPDGTQLAFDRNGVGQFAGDIYVINVDGSGLKRLTADGFDDSDPAWSPDGSQIAFGRNGRIYVMNASDGSGLRALTTGGYDFHPTWSPDGSRIAFASSRSGANAIYVMDADGTSIRQITRDSLPDYDPWWSPDGQRIAFQRESGVGFIYLINPDGTGLTKLTLFGRTPSWSPDSRVIVFEQYGLTTVNVDGSGMLRFGIGFDPAWSPAGGMPPRPQPFVSLSITGGDAQTGAAGATLPESLTVRATRDDGTPVSGAHISWYLPNGGLPSQPYLSTYLSVTDTRGLVSVSLTLGASAPVQIKLRAAVTDGTGRTAGVEFTATAAP